MRAVPADPPAAPNEVVSGLSCPECLGVLNVSADGPRATLRFRCRVGHLYSTEEVVIGKERRLEEHVWMAVTLLEELVTFLHELGDGGSDPVARTCVERAARATGQARTLRQFLADNVPTAVSGASPECP
jgi:two-component system chemotaxis response regulator CheB